MEWLHKQSIIRRSSNLRGTTVLGIIQIRAHKIDLLCVVFSGVPGPVMFNINQVMEPISFSTPGDCTLFALSLPHKVQFGGFAKTKPFTLLVFHGQTKV